MVKKVMEINEKMEIARKILESLPDWFGNLEAREKYIVDSMYQQFYAVMEDEIPVGFLSLKETGKDTIEIAVMGVLKEFHHHGIGRELFYMAKEEAIKMGYSFMQVKTVQLGCYKEYDLTNRFYLSLGFKEFEVLLTLWGEQNPCQVYVMSLS